MKIIMADTGIQSLDMHTDTHYTPYTNTNNTHYTLHTNIHYTHNILYLAFATERQNNWTLSLKQCSYKENSALGEFHRG